MQNIVIKGIHGWEGEYPFDMGALTMGDLRTIKRLSGVRAGEIAEALGAGDTDVVVAIAVIATEKNGKVGAEHVLWNAAADVGITLDLGDDEDEGDVSPPALIPTPPPESPESGSEKAPPTGETGESVGDDSQEMHLRAIGSQG